MGANDAKEQLEVAIEVTGQLEREVRELTAKLAQRTAQRDEFKRLFAACHPVHLDGVQKAHAMQGERDAAYALIERVLNLTGDIGPEARRILTQVPANALAAHDAEVAATALDKARDNLMPSYNWNLDPYTGNERPGTSAIDELYGDVHREMTAAAAAYRAVGE